MADHDMDPTGVAPDTAQTMAEHVQRVSASSGGGLDVLMNVELNLTVELGRCRMKINDIVNLGSGSVVELQKLASEPVDILVNCAGITRDGTLHSIPLHRIREVYRNDKLIWHRAH